MIIVCSIFDRLRGSNYDFISSAIEKIIYGIAAGILCGLTDWYLVAVYSALFAVGSSSGWGEPMGAVIENRKMKIHNVEWWQCWIFERNAILALMFRGAMWGGCIAPLAYWDMNVLWTIPAMMLAMPIAAKTGNLMIGKVNDPWAAQEYVRGALFGLLLCLFMMLNK